MDFSNAFRKYDKQQTVDTHDVDDRKSPMFGNSLDVFGPSHQRK